MENKDKHTDPFKKDRERNDALNKADKFNEKKLPGNYPKEEDIMNQQDLQKTTYIDDTENSGGSIIGSIAKAALGDDPEDGLPDAHFNLTKEDLDALGEDELAMDGGEDDMLRERGWPVDMSGEDLDLPGVELDDENEAIGSEDEENNGYSLSDNNDDED